MGEIIDKVYQKNIESDYQISTSHLFQQIVSIEPKLASWKAELPPLLRVRTRAEILQHLQDPSVFSSLSTVLTLRYLNVRTLLHRAILTRFLDHGGQKNGGGDEWSFLHEFGRTSLEVSVSSAAEMIEILYTMSEGRHRMFTTWWFSIYYGQLLRLLLALFSTNQSVAFSSALIVFAAMIIKHKHQLQIPGFKDNDFAHIIQRALQALDNLGNEARIAVRCRKYLKKFVHIASTIGKCHHVGSNKLQN